MKVLIVDDNQAITDLLSKFLTSRGFENESTNNPKDGLELIINKKYEVVLLDITMPEFSGLDIIKALEENKVLKNQKIIIFSASAFPDSEINDLLKKEGIHGCVKKPIQLSRLLTVIAN